MYVLLFIFLSLPAALLLSVAWRALPWTKKLLEACNNDIC